MMQFSEVLEGAVKAYLRAIPTDDDQRLTTLKEKAMKPIHILAFTTMLTLAVACASPSQAQEQGPLDRAVLDSAASAFNILASRFEEFGYRYWPMQEDYLRGTRNEVCAIVDTDDGRTGVRLIANAGRQSLRELTDAERRDLWERARSGDRFTEFLREEDDLLARNDVLTEEARELVLQLAIDFRRSVAWPASDDQEALSDYDAEFGVTLLCDEQRSPGRVVSQVM